MGMWADVLFATASSLVTCCSSSELRLYRTKKRQPNWGKPWPPHESEGKQSESLVVIERNSLKKSLSVMGPIRWLKRKHWHKRKTRNWEWTQREKQPYRQRRRHLWALNANVSSKSAAPSSHAAFKNIRPLWTL